MKVFYIVCKKCGRASPLPGYFFPEWKGIKDKCIWCLEKKIKKIKGPKRKGEKIMYLYLTLYRKPLRIKTRNELSKHQQSKGYLK